MRVVVHQGLKPQEMSRQEPTKTKMIPFVNDKTNMYIQVMGGGIAILHTSSTYPGNSWDGFIFDRGSDKLIQNMIESLQWIQKHKKGIFNAQDKAAKARRGEASTNKVRSKALSRKASKGRKKGAGEAHLQNNGGQK